ncbi:Hypothetical predicted protein [Mytilus galloprovincialis]|uniref:Fido domain-containing protein n=1 Tax=Mytilus galloprovincialis TaxID=29158 RepID=A0A8B6E2J6_MYTGA|nr:Hypothetical predicted protein [Mytilus galloprovincialis]
MLVDINRYHTMWIQSGKPINEQVSDEMVKDFLIQIKQGEDIDGTAKEMENLQEGFKHLRGELMKLSDKEQKNYVGELDVETCVQECHRVLMKDLLDETRTQPGRFSVLPRSANFDGNDYLYPTYATEEIAYQAVDTLILEYNKMVRQISHYNHDLKIERLIKCASVFLFGFLSIHPFSDGNGRLARLLCSHCLAVFCPFQTSIHNSFSHSARSDYVRAIVNDRQPISAYQIQYKEDAVKETGLVLEQSPIELCSVVIESNWFTWRQFLHKIGEPISLFDFEK